MAKALTVASWNCRGFSDSTVSELLAFFSTHRPAVIGLQDLGGNRDEPAAARLHSARATLAGNGIIFSSDLANDSSVAVLWSSELPAEETDAGRSDHSHTVTLLAEIQKYIVNQALSQSIHNHTAATITQHTSVHFTIAASLLSAHFGTTIATQQHHSAHRRSQLRSRQVIEDAFELHASMRARPEMNYYYYY